MIGTKHIKVYNKRVNYEFDIERNVSIINGNSATGKTTLYNLIRDHEQNENNGVSLISDVKCMTLSNNDWEAKIEKYSNVIFFIDERNRFYKSIGFAEKVLKSDCYFVIITRESIPSIPYSVDAIYEISGSGKNHKLVKKYDLKKINYWLPKIVKDYRKFNDFVTEDSESGLQLFIEIAKSLQKDCKTSEGNSNLYKYVNDKRVLVADSAAYGAYIEKTLDAIKIRNSSYIYLPECVEWIILNVIKLDGINKRKVLDKAGKNVDTGKFFSYEKYFYDLLKTATKNDKLFKYSKKKLSKNYTNKNNVKKFIKFIFGM